MIESFPFFSHTPVSVVTVTSEFANFLFQLWVCLTIPFLTLLKYNDFRVLIGSSKYSILPSSNIVGRCLPMMGVFTTSRVSEVEVDFLVLSWFFFFFSSSSFLSFSSSSFFSIYYSFLNLSSSSFFSSLFLFFLLQWILTLLVLVFILYLRPQFASLVHQFLFIPLVLSLFSIFPLLLFLIFLFFFS